MKNREEIENLRGEILLIAKQADDEFGALTADHLNWKPAPTSWSVAQCFDHLITTNETYFPVFEALKTGTKKTTVVQRLPLLPKLWGRFLMSSVDPKTTRKIKAPKKFQPSSSHLASSIITDFAAHQNRIADEMSVAINWDTERIIISSPAASFVTLSLLDAFRILVSHEHRHFQQALRVKANQNFPN